MQCATNEYIDESGKWVVKAKRKYDTLELAIQAAKHYNAKPERITKVVAYKCNVCFKYHIGRNGKQLSEKERLKFQKQLGKDKKNKRHEKLVDVKIVGFIDLSKIRY